MRGYKLAIAQLKSVKLNYLQLKPQIQDQDTSSQHPVQDVVMVHGLATNLAFWYPVASGLSQTHQVTLLDLRGHGRSSMPQNGYTSSQMAEDLKELMDAVSLDKVHLAGHSFGGSVVLQFALRYPERVQSLILADVRLKLWQPHQRPRDWSHWHKLQPTLEKVGIDLDENETEAGYRLLIEMARLQLRTPSGDSSVPKLLSRLYPQGDSQRTAKRFLKLIDTTTAWQDVTADENLTVESLQSLKIPTLAIYGEQSPNLPTAKALSQCWTHAHLQFVPHAGHFFPVSQPEKFISAVEDFWNSISPIRPDLS